MGTGKSSVGRIVAHQLQFRFVDTDEMIESETGQSIPEIFANQGEAAFRELERRVVQRLTEERGVVIAGPDPLRRQQVVEVIDPEHQPAFAGRRPRLAERLGQRGLARARRPVQDYDAAHVAHVCIIAHA